MGAEKFAFQAESKQLLNLMVHSIYTNKEIFLRELISNASDAIDRLRFESITRPEMLIPGEKFEIRLDADPKARTLTISDNGIGMDHEELIKHIGTIARSGTQEFMKKPERKENRFVDKRYDRAVRRRLLFGLHGRRLCYNRHEKGRL